MDLELASSVLSERTLSIEDLNDVISLLERHKYCKTSYDRLGLCLKLSQNTLETIKKDHGDVRSCFTECLASWLRKFDRVENPTIDTLIAALRRIGENAVADGIYKESQGYRSGMLRNQRELEATPPTLHTNTSEGYPSQQVIANPGVHDLEHKIDQVSELQRIADKLQEKYLLLVLAVKKSLKDHCVNVEDAKFLVKECLKRKARVVSELMPCMDTLEKANDFESFFSFLSKHDFIGYINYKLLKKLSLLVDDDTVNRLFFEYEEEYAKLLSATSFQDLIPFFREKSDLSPTAPLGLPYISFCLQRPLFASIYSWISTFGQFSWSYYAFLKQLRENCIIITYAILPCVLDDVMRDLTDPVILKELKDKEVTVIELPQEEDFEANEDGKSSIMQTTSSEGKIPTTNTTTSTTALEGETALVAAARGGHDKIVQLLSEEDDLNASVHETKRQIGKKESKKERESMEDQLHRKMKEEAVNKEGRAFLENIPRLQLGLATTITTVALHCYAKELIPGEVYKGMFEGEWSPEYSRAQYFLNCVHKKLRQYEDLDDTGAVKRTITTLASIIRSDSALEHIASILDGCSTARQFKMNSPNIYQGIQASLISIAMGAAAENIITYSECQACVQGDANAEERRIRMVLNEIYEGINKDSKVLGKFLDILRKMEPPTSNYCKPIEQKLGLDEPDH